MLEFRSTKSGIWARPCEIPGIDKIIHQALATVDCYSNQVHDEFLNTYFAHLTKCDSNHLQGIDGFSSKSYIHGTTQAFDEFYLRHHDKRLRTFPGEFAYHKIAARSGRMNWLEIDESKPLEHGDCLALSVPFSASCSIYVDIEEIFNICDAKNIPIHLDFAYLGISKNISINLNHPSIYSLSFSLSKVYYGIERLRAGMRLKRDFEDDYIDFANEFKMYNIAGAWTGIQLLKKFPPDSLYKTLKPICEKIIERKGYQHNNTCIFASIPNAHNDYLNYKRGQSNYSRICLSEMISDELHQQGFTL